MDKKEKIITVEVRSGCVVDVRGMPEGYLYEIKDHDVEDLKHLDERK